MNTTAVAAVAVDISVVAAAAADVKTDLVSEGAFHCQGRQLQEKRYGLHWNQHKHEGLSSAVGLQGRSWPRDAESHS